MFAKAGFVLRSLFVTFVVGSLVACTFEGGQEEEQGSTSSEVGKKAKNGAADAAVLDDEDAGSWNNDPDAGPWGDDEDGGAYGNDGGGWVDGGGFDGGGWVDGGYQGDGGGHNGDGGYKADGAVDGGGSNTDGGW